MLCYNEREPTAFLLWRETLAACCHLRRTRCYRHFPSRRVRLLLGCLGWPCGILEIASWARQQGLADAVVFQMQPGFVMELDADDRRWLAPGVVAAELVESFSRLGTRLSSDALLVQRCPATWEIVDRGRGFVYRVLESDGRLGVVLPEQFEGPELTAAVDRWATARGRRSEFLDPDGAFTPEVQVALMVVGGQFVRKLIDFSPHVVGFRIEGGGFEQVCEFVRAVRLFSDAEVVLGGPTATSHPCEVLGDCGADYVFAGEAEESFCQFLRLAHRRHSKDRQPEIPGLAYTYGGRRYHNTLPRDGYERTVLDTKEALPRLPIDGSCSWKNLVRPLAGREIVAGNRLDWTLLENFRRETDSLFFTGGRGCPGACTFCAKLHGQSVRVKPAEQLLAEIEDADVLVGEGRLSVTQWELFKHTDDPELRSRRVAWAAVYDEDFFLDRRRAVAFFALWDRSPLRDRYRLSFQTNPCSLLGSGGRPDGELFAWIDRLKPMIQLGAESFHEEVLSRWHKRHDVAQLSVVLDALDRTGQDYTVFQLLTDYQTTPHEFVESLRRLILAAYEHRRMRIASTAFTIPLYDSLERRMLEYSGRFDAGLVRHFTDYERAQPGWMNPLVADLADRADAELHWTLFPEQREGALYAAFSAVLERIAALAGRATPGRVKRIACRCANGHEPDPGGTVRKIGKQVMDAGKASRR